MTTRSDELRRTDLQQIMAEHRLILTNIQVIITAAITIMMNDELTVTTTIIIKIHLYVVGVIITIGLTKLSALRWSRSDVHSFSHADQKHGTKDKRVI